MVDRAHVRKDYATDQIVVHWDSSLCIHSAECLRALPQVFDTRRRPWVQVERAGVEALAAAVDTCPSRALTYSRLDGGELGLNGIPTPGDAEPSSDQLESVDEVPVVISLKPDGPLAIEGPVRIELARGEVLQVTDKAFLCRCGGSSTKPYCDGTHKKNGFEAEGW